MGNRRQPAPRLMTSVDSCELRDGLVWIEVSYGDKSRTAALPMRQAMRLYFQLGAVLSRQNAPTCMLCAERSRRERG